MERKENKISSVFLILKFNFCSFDIVHPFFFFLIFIMFLIFSSQLVEVYVLAYVAKMSIQNKQRYDLKKSTQYVVYL